MTDREATPNTRNESAVNASAKTDSVPQFDSKLNTTALKLPEKQLKDAQEDKGGRDCKDNQVFDSEMCPGPFGFIKPWRLNRSNLERGTPSREDGVSFGEETKFRRKGCEAILKVSAATLRLLCGDRRERPQEVGQRLKDNRHCVQAVAQMLLHRYFTYTSVKELLEHPQQAADVHAACFMLACKVEDVGLPVDFIIKAMRNDILKNKPPTKEQSRMWRDRIFKSEVEILKVCCFQFNFDLPFELLTYTSPVVAAVQNIPFDNGNKNTKLLATMARRVAADMFATVACILYSGKHLASTAVYMAAQIAERKPDLTWKGLSFDWDMLRNNGTVTFDCIIDICNMVLQLPRWKSAKWLVGSGDGVSLTHKVHQAAQIQGQGTTESRGKRKLIHTIADMKSIPATVESKRLDTAKR